MGTETLSLLQKKAQSINAFLEANCNCGSGKDLQTLPVIRRLVHCKAPQDCVAKLHPTQQDDVKVGAWLRDASACVESNCNCGSGKDLQTLPVIRRLVHCKAPQDCVAKLHPTQQDDVKVGAWLRDASACVESNCNCGSGKDLQTLPVIRRLVHCKAPQDCVAKLHPTQQDDVKVGAWLRDASACVESNCNCGSGKDLQTLPVIRRLVHCKAPQDCVAKLHPTQQDDVKVTVLDMVSGVPESTFCAEGLLSCLVTEWLQSICSLSKKLWQEESAAAIYIICKKSFKFVIDNPDEESYKRALTVLVLDVLSDLDQETVVTVMKSFYTALSEAMNAALVKESFVDVCAMLTVIRQVNGLFVRRLTNGNMVLEQLLLESLSPYSSATIDLFRTKIKTAFGNLNDLLAINNAVLDNHVEHLVQVYEHIFRALQGSSPLNEIGSIAIANSGLCLEVARKFPAEISEYSFIQIGVVLHRVYALLQKYDVGETSKCEGYCVEFRSRLMGYYASTFDEFVLQDSCGSNDHENETSFWENSACSFSVEMWRRLVLNFPKKIRSGEFSENAGNMLRTVLEGSLKTLASRFVRAKPSSVRRQQFKADALLVVATALEVSHLKLSASASKLCKIILSGAGFEQQDLRAVYRLLSAEGTGGADPETQLLSVYMQACSAIRTRDAKIAALTLSNQECLLSTLLARHFLELDKSELMLALLDFVVNFEWDLGALWKTISPLCRESQEAHEDGRGNVSSTLWYTTLVKICAKYAKPMFAKSVCSEIIRSEPEQLFELLVLSLPDGLLMFDKKFSEQIGTFGGLRVLFALLLDATSQLLHELESEPTQFTFQDVIIHNLKPVLTDLRKIINSYDSTAQTLSLVDCLKVKTDDSSNFSVVIVTEHMKNTDYEELLDYLAAKREWLHDNLGRPSVLGLQCPLDEQWNYSVLSKLCE